jgi:hypothetical protein
MLLRYTHLCTPSLAKRLDQAFADQKQITLHRGQRRLKKGATLTMSDIADFKPDDAVVCEPLQAESTDGLPDELPPNVLPFRPRHAA